MRKNKYNRLLLATVLASMVLLQTDSGKLTEASMTQVTDNATTPRNEIPEKKVIHQSIKARAFEFEIAEAEEVALAPGVQREYVEFKSPNTEILYKVYLKNLVDTYNKCEKLDDWDENGMYREIYTIYEFLVNQMGANKTLTYAMLGNIACEGKFAQEQGTKQIAKSTEEIINNLSNKDKHGGYGVVQWTSRGRKNALIKYYEEADKVTENFVECKILAECIFLYEEFLAYDIYDSWSTEVELEDACGRIAVLYEGYSGCKKDWEVVDGKYSLIKKDNKENNRLRYSKNIAENFE